MVGTVKDNVFSGKMLQCGKAVRRVPILTGKANEKLTRGGMRVLCIKCPQVAIGAIFRVYFDISDETYSTVAHRRAR